MKTFVLLLAEDNEDDVLLFRRAFREFEPLWNLVRVGDGAEVLDYCVQNGFPDLLVTDLNMPKLSGLEVLAWIEANAAGKHLPKLAYSSLCDSQTARMCVAAGADEVCDKRSVGLELNRVLGRLMAKVEVESTRLSGVYGSELKTAL